MESTGEYSSDLLGRDERQHMTLGEMVRSMLYISNLDAKYCCFAIMYAVYIKRRWCNYPQTPTPHDL